MAGNDAKRGARQQSDVPTNSAPSWHNAAQQDGMPQGPATSIPIQSIPVNAAVPAPVGPSAPQKECVPPKEAFAQHPGNFMTNMAPPTLQDLENDGRLADANSNPGMNLLLSLTLKLVPNAKNGEMGNTFDFAHAPPMLLNGPGPGEANAALSQNAPPPPPVSAVPDMRPTASAAPMALSLIHI